MDGDSVVVPVVVAVALADSVSTAHLETTADGDGQRLVLPPPPGLTPVKGSGKKKRKVETDDFPLDGSAEGQDPSPFLRALQLQQTVLQGDLVSAKSDVADARQNRNTIALQLQEQTQARREREDATISRFAHLLRSKTKRLRELELEQDS